MANNKERKFEHGNSYEEREIKRLENSALKRLNKNYASEMYDLLYFSKNYNDNYPKKRININKICRINKNCKTIDTDENIIDNIYIQLSKTKIKPTLIINKTEKNKNENKKTNFFTNIEKNREIYEQLRTKNDINFYKNDIYNSIKNEHLSPKIIKNNSLPKMNFHSPSFSTSINKNVFNKPVKLEIVSGFDKHLAKCVEKNLFCDKLTKNQKRDLKYINELKFFNYIDKMSNKSKLINEIKKHEKNKKVLKRNVFNYDKEKWENYKNFTGNENGVIINKLNNENQKCLYGLKNEITTLCFESKDAKEDVIKHLNKMDIFLNKNGIFYDENANYGINKNSIINKEN